MRKGPIFLPIFQESESSHRTVGTVESVMEDFFLEVFTKMMLMMARALV